MNDELKKAIEIRDEYIKNNPHLKEQQKEIDDVLNKCRQEDRLAVITMMLMGKTLELQKLCMQLQETMNGKT